MVTATPVSATEVAAATGLAHAAASYHLRQLAAARLIERIGPPEVAPHRSGRPLQRYRMRDAAFRDLERSSARALHQALLRELERRLGMPTKQSRTADAEVWLSAADWRAVRRLIEQAGAVVHRRGRAPGSRGAKHVSFTTLLLEFRR